MSTSPSESDNTNSSGTNTTPSTCVAVHVATTPTTTATPLDNHKRKSSSSKPSSDNHSHDSTSKSKVKDIDKPNTNTSTNTSSGSTSISLLHSTPPVARRLMCFIDGTMEADRAFYASLQWLRHGDHLSAVYIVDGSTIHGFDEPKGITSIFSSGNSNTSGTSGSGSDISESQKEIHRAHLAREKVHQMIARYAGMAREAQVHNVQAVAVATSGGRSIAEEAIHYATQMHIDCVITGTRQQGAIKRFFLGSFSSYLLNHSECDVMIIKSDLPGRHVIRGEECPIAKAAFEAHRSLHEGVAGSFAGHSVPESTVRSDPSKPLHRRTCGDDHSSSVAGSSGDGAHHASVDTTGAAISHAMTRDVTGAKINTNTNNNSNTKDVADKLRSLAMHEVHNTKDDKPSSSSSGSGSTGDAADITTMRPPSPH